MTYTFSFSKANKSLETAAYPIGGIVLNLQEPTTIIAGTISVPTHGFVPIPKNALDVEFALGLYEDDIRIPAQIEVAQTWSAAGKPKFVHVHFVGKYDDGVPREYVLKEETLPDTPPATNLVVTEDSSIITIDNDIIKVIISKTDYCGIQQMWYDPTGTGTYGSPILNSTAGGPIYVGAAERLWKPQYDPSATVEVEQSGDVKVTILAEGDFQKNYTNANSPTTNPNANVRCINRIIIYAGLPWVIFQTVSRIKSNLKTDNAFTNNTILPSAGYCREIYDLKFHLPFENITNYSMGIDGTTLSDTLPAYSAPSVTNNLLKDLIAFWPMEETSGIRYNAVGDHHHLKTYLENSPVASTTGVIGNAALFSYTTTRNWFQMFDDDIVFDVGGTDSFAISVWIKLTTKNAAPMFMSKWDQNNLNSRTFTLGYGLNLGAVVDKFYFQVGNGSTSVSAATNNGVAIATGQWYHIVAQFNGSNNEAKIVINNGTPVTATLTGSLLHTTSPITIGSNSNQGSPHDANATYSFDGAMDMMGFWRRTLTTQEITDLYNSASGLDYPFGLTPEEIGVNSTVAYLHQYKHDELRLLGDAESHDTGTMEKSDSWANVTTSDNVRISLLAKDLWKRYPKELELSRDGITYHTWPKNGFEVWDVEEQINNLNINQNLNFQTGKTLKPQMQQEYVAMQQVGPGYICTVDIDTDLVVTNQAHGWSTGQTIQFMRGNVTSTLPTSSPQIVANNWIYYGSTSFSVNNAISSDTITLTAGANGWTTGQSITVSGGNRFGLGSGTTYYVYMVTPSTFKICSTPGNAVNGSSFVSLTTGTGTITAVTAGGGWTASTVSTGFGTGGLNDFYYIRVNDTTSFGIYGTLTDAQNNTNKITFSVAETGTLMVGTTVYQGDVRVDENFPPSAYRGGMHGVNLYDEFAIIVSPTSTSFDDEAWQELFRQHPIAVPEATYRNIPNSFGDVAARGAYFTDIEESIENQMIGWGNFERWRGYGHINHGDGHHEWLTLLPYNDASSPPRAALARNWLTSHYFTVEQLWAMVYHSCTEPVLSLARICSEHTSMIDTVRYDAAATRSFGMCHTKACLHWLGGTSTWEHFGDSDSYLYSWLIDANLWAKDNFEALRDATFVRGIYPQMDIIEDLAYYNSPAIQSDAHWREYVSSIKRVCSMYEYTHDVRFLPFIYRVGREAINHNLNSSQLTGPLWHPQWPTKYYDLTHDPDYDGANGYITRGVTGLLTRIPFSPNTNVGLTNSGILSMSLKAKAYKITGDRDYLRDHMAYLDRQKGFIANLPNNPLYHHYGRHPGVIGNYYLPLVWPEYLKQLNEEGIIELDDPESFDDYWGSMMSGSSSYYGDPTRALTVFILKTVDAPWVLDMRVYPPGPGGSSDALGLDIKRKTLGPTPSLNISTSTDGTQLFKLNGSGGSVNFFRSEPREGGPTVATINTSTNIITTTAQGWDTGQFVKFEPPVTSGVQYINTITLPVSSPQVVLEVDYYIRVLSTTTFTLHPTAADAYANTNIIDFSTTGTGVNLMIRGTVDEGAHAEARARGTWYLNSDGNTGLYVAYIGGNNGVVHPISDFPECSVIHNNATVTGAYGRYSRGFIEPIQTYPIYLIITHVDNENVTNVRITDLHGDLVAEASLIPNLQQSLTVTIQQGDTTHPTPWRFEANSVLAWQFQAIPVNGETDQKLLLYGTNISHIQQIKSMLKYKIQYVMGGGLSLGSTATTNVPAWGYTATDGLTMAGIAEIAVTT